MLQLLWDMFKETGRVNTYMFYKALEQENMEVMVGEMGKDAPEVPDGKPTIGQGTQLKGQA